MENNSSLTGMENNFDLKVKYDTFFDEIFFSKDFTNKMVENFKYCPNGLTFDTKINEDKDNIYFKVCAKEYGYEYPNEHVIGDFTINSTNKVTEEMVDYMINYLFENGDKEVLKEIENKDILYCSR